MREVDTDSVRYKENFISWVIFRLDIEPILLLKDSLVPNLQEQIKLDLPSFQEVPGNKSQTEVTNGQSTDQQKKTFNQYVFENPDKGLKLSIAFNVFLYEVTKYTNFVDYIETLQKLLGAFYRHYNPVVIKRLRYRFINEIQLKDGDPLDWSGILNEDLTKIFESELFANVDVSRTMAQTQYQFDDYAMVFTYGIYNSEFPSRISRKEYILDYECYTNDVEYSQIEDKLKIYNKRIVQMFENSIEEDLRQILRGKDE